MQAVRSAWQDDFPNTIIDRKLADATSHWCYQKAKMGDTLSAYILAKELVSDIGCYALTDKQYSAQLKLSNDTLQKLRNHYAELECFWQQTFGYGFGYLTESEAKFITNSGKTIDEIRTLISKIRNGSILKAITDPK